MLRNQERGHRTQVGGGAGRGGAGGLWKLRPELILKEAGRRGSGQMVRQWVGHSRQRAERGHRC